MSGRGQKTSSQAALYALSSLHKLGVCLVDISYESLHHLVALSSSSQIKGAQICKYS